VFHPVPRKDGAPGNGKDFVNQFAGGIAHIFNNLLSVIQGNAELASTATGQQKNRHLGGILRASERGAELLSWILSYSQNQMLNPTPTDLRDFVDRSASMWARMVPETIEVIVERGLEPCVVEIDSNHLSTAFLNLIVNARDSIDEEGEITIATGISNVDEPARAAILGVPMGRYGFLSVSDTGCGIDRSNLDRVWEPFFSVNKKGVPGLGLGLSMVRGFVAQSGGALEIESEPNSGTTVKLLFAVTDNRAVETKAPVEPDEIPLGNGEAILVVEDDSELRQLLVVMLESLNYRVSAFESAEIALENSNAIETGRLVLADIHLPGGLDGLALAEKVSVVNPELKVVLMSANPRHVDNDGIRPTAVDDFILKPFTRERLARVVQAALVHRR
jgi:CheY-like chemotaxis protein